MAVRLPPMEFTLSKHASDTVRERNILPEWISRTLTQPALEEEHAHDPTRRHAFLPIPEHGGRVLHVVYNHTKNPPHIVTVYFDRARKGTL